MRDDDALADGFMDFSAGWKKTRWIFRRQLKSRRYETKGSDHEKEREKLIQFSISAEAESLQMGLDLIIREHIN